MGDPVDVRGLDSISAILGGADFEPVRYAERHAEIADRLGFDVSEIVRITKHIPLCLRGADHQDSRKRLASLIASRAEITKDIIDSVLPDLIAKLLAPGRRDVMQTFVFPLVDALMTVMVDARVTFEPDTMVSRIFSQSIGVAKRRRMNAEIGALRKQIEIQRPELSEIEVGDRVALCILGTDTLRGTLGCSLHHIFADENARVPADETYPPCTGVPYIDREAIVPVRVEDHDYKEAATFRAWLKGFEGFNESAARRRFFGFGSHTCLGRKLSLEIWRTISAGIKQNACSIRVVTFTKRRDDVFSIPQTFEIEVSLCLKS